MSELLPEYGGEIVSVGDVTLPHSATGLAGQLNIETVGASFQQ